MRCRHRTAFATAAALAGLFLAGVATASNMGFALNLSLPVEGSPSRHWVSLPWVYAPTTAKALCADLGGSTKVASVWRWDEASSSFVSHACTFTTDGFSLVKGVAYGVQNAPGQTVTARVVGSRALSLSSVRISGFRRALVVSETTANVMGIALGG